MKSVITILSLVVSANVFAYSLTDSTVILSASPLLTSAATSTRGYAKRQAAVIINDAQELIQSGRASAFLSQKIKEAQEVNDGASESDALEMLVNEAEAILAK